MEPKRDGTDNAGQIILPCGPLTGYNPCFTGEDRGRGYYKIDDPRSMTEDEATAVDHLNVARAYELAAKAGEISEGLAAQVSRVCKATAGIL